jgi:hypothetical protein
VGKIKELAGKKFGRLQVIKYAGRNKHNQVLWETLCDCGNVKIVRSGNLISGHTQSCGCLHKERIKASHTKELETGLVFGKLTVIKRVENTGMSINYPNGFVSYLCKCACGNMKVVTGIALRKGDVKSCGCLKPKSKHVPIIQGSVFNGFTVLHRVENRGKLKTVPYYLCRCECGREVEVRSSALRNGTSKSCGCLRVKNYKETIRKALVGKRFGRLEVLCWAGATNNNASIWKCRCDCGNECNVRGENLLKGDTRSCGCYNKQRTRETHSGLKHHNWKGGISPISDALRNLPEMTQWKKKILNRDNYICQYSGKQGKGDLHVHHIKPFHQILEENNITSVEEALECEELWDISNGITLAKEFHCTSSNNPISFHRMYGVTTTKEDFCSWLVGGPYQKGKYVR